jgi:hypothetical protein
MVAPIGRWQDPDFKQMLRCQTLVYPPAEVWCGFIAHPEVAQASQAEHPSNRVREATGETMQTKF